MTTRTTSMGRARDRAGFTLLEILMSAFVVALGSLGLLALFAGAASQQQRSAVLTNSVTLSKNAEALIKSKIQQFGTSASLGCLVPNFVPDAWYALPADRRFGYITINPTNDPNTEALYIEETPRGGDTPLTLYRATAILNDVIMGVASVQGGPRVPYTIGSPPLRFQLDDRRVLLRGEQDLEVTFRIRRQDCDTDFEILLPPANPADDLVYTFTGTCSQASNNVIFLGQGSPAPTSTTEDHVRINTESFPVDGTNNASLIGFLIDQIEQPDQTVVVEVNPVDDSVTGVFPECRLGDTGDFYEAYYLDTPTAAAGQDVYIVGDASRAEFTVITDPRTSQNSQTRIRNVADINAIDDTNNSGLVLTPGTGLPKEFNGTFNGEFLIRRGSPLGGTFYSTTPDNAGDPVAGKVSLLLYPSQMVDEIIIDYRRRADELISLNDRVSFVNDPNFRGSRRPDMAYSVLYRDRAGRASDQFVVFTYSLAASRSDAEWFPPETAENIEDGEAPLRRADGVDLVYDAQNDRYLVVIDRQEHGWMAGQGQLLFFAGASQTGSAASGPGAETAVRVVDVIERENDVIHLILDQPPRAGGETLLRVFYGNSNAGAFDVWAVQPDIRSASDDSVWSLKPIEARAFQAGEGS